MERRKIHKNERNRWSCENRHLIRLSLILLTVFSTEVNGQQISQIPQFLPLQEGENFTTYCNSSSTLSSLQWYKQSPGGSPVLLMILAKGGEVKTEQRLTGRLGETTKQGSLHLAAAQLSDVGTYFCAGHSALEASAVCPQTSLWSPGVTPLHFSSGRGQRKLKSQYIYEEIEFLIKKKNPWTQTALLDNSTNLLKY